MARKYRVIDGLGRCTVGLRGTTLDQHTRAQLLRQELTGSIFILVTNSEQRRIVPVTSMEPGRMLTCLSHFSWEFDPDATSVRG